MDKLEFINHSGIAITQDGKSIAVDPWVEGNVFNNSWSLLTRTSENSINTVRESDFIWFSHEHPDHFNPPNIPLFGKNKNFIFQKTKDKRVVNFLRKYSNNIFELKSGENFQISKNFSIEACPFQDLDSYCVIKAGNKTILNLNDCQIKSEGELKEIKRKIGTIDLLMAQFSYAIGNTNRNEKALREKNAKEILENLNRIIFSLKPEFFLPFASFSFFSHKENFYLNDSINKIDKSVNFLEKSNPNTKILCFYPGDTWNFDKSWNNDIPINKYKKDYSKISESSSEIKEIKDIKIDSLIEISRKYILQIKKNNNMFDLYNLFNKKYYSIIFKVTDLKLNLIFDYKNGIVEKNISNPLKQYCEISSDSLYQLFSSGYGFDALLIGGRYETDKEGFKALKKIFKFQAKNYQNHFYNFAAVIPKILKKLSKKGRVNPSR